jgi:hypothetical protein
MRHTYYVNLVTNHGENVSSTAGTFANKRKAVSFAIQTAKKERADIKSWTQHIHELSIETEDETGETVDIRIAFDKDGAYNDSFALKPYKWH